MRILIVDDNRASLDSLSVVLSDLGHQPETAQSAEEALEKSIREDFPLVITDLRMPGMDGLDLLSRLKENPRGAAQDVVILTGHGDMDSAIEALRRGAYDYLNKPINARELASLVDRSAEHLALLIENRDFREQFDAKVNEATHSIRQDLNTIRRRLKQVTGVGDIVAESMLMRQVLAETSLYHKDTTVPVLIEGETGTGKEIVAQLIHHGDLGNDSPFVAINCSAIPSQLFESEIFGHEPGAYTGSSRRGAAGKLELVGKGTLFLDEIAEMPMALQPKLLRVLEERCFFRLGGVKKHRLEGRIICAANRPLASLVETGRFRRDLYHRLKVGYLKLPPLRDRPEDIEALARYFLQRESARKRKRFKCVHPSVMEMLFSHPWPGNVRELENAMERAVLTCDGEELLPAHLGFLKEESLTSSTESASVSLLDQGIEVQHLPKNGLNLEELLDRLTQLALEKHEGNKSLAARYLGISRYALHRRLKKS